MKKDRRVTSHDTEEWSKLWRRTDVLFLKNDIRNLVNFNASSGKSENLHSDELLFLKVCNVWAKKIQRNCAVKNDLWFQKWHKEFGEFSHKKLKVMLGKFLCDVLAEGMYFLDKSNPSNSTFLDFSLLVWSFLNLLCDFWNQESVFS